MCYDLPVTISVFCGMISGKANGMSESLRHLVFVRHGESEGDVRRAAWRRGESFTSTKHPEEEELTDRGAEQSRLAGAWIARHILEKYALTRFDGYFVSLSRRSLQSAVAMGFEDAVWLGDERLNERNRGLIRGLKAEQHRAQFPGSYERMQTDPLHWVPPGGESIAGVAERWSSFQSDIRSLHSVLIVGHRDQMWAAMQPLEHLSDRQLLAVDTDQIGNAQVIHYMAADPQPGRQTDGFAWKCSVNPVHPETSEGWQRLTDNSVLSA